MSIRTFLEVNHDFLSRLDRDDVCGRELRLALNNHDESKKDLALKGVRVLTSRHHSEPFQISVSGHVRYEED